MLGFELDDLLASKLLSENRPPDGRLHPSGDLLGSLRHSQLRAAGAPTIDGDVVSAIRMKTGTMWHSWFEDLFVGKPVMTEVKLDPYLPEGWSGTADWVIWSDEYQGFVLGDLKTTKGEAIKWIARDGIKQEHQWQVSAYWHALYDMGLPMVDAYIVYYLPQNQVIERGEFADVRPLTLEGKPLSMDTLFPVMESRYAATKAYIDEISISGACEGYARYSDLPAELFLNDLLDPVQARVAKEMKNRAKDQTDIVLVPHWSAAYCSYPPELCNCREQGNTKIGHITNEGEYVPRKGFEVEFAAWSAASVSK